MSDLTELLERIEKATGPDREIDHRLQGLLINRGNFGEYPDLETWVKAGLQFNWNTPALTASIDAALALVERKLPGWAWKLVKEEGRFFFVLRNAARLENVAPAWVQSGESAPLAILAALLRALIAQQAKP